MFKASTPRTARTISTLCKLLNSPSAWLCQSHASFPFLSLHWWHLMVEGGGVHRTNPEFSGDICLPIGNSIGKLVVWIPSPNFAFLFLCMSWKGLYVLAATEPNDSLGGGANGQQLTYKWMSLFLFCSLYILFDLVDLPFKGRSLGQHSKNSEIFLRWLEYSEEILPFSCCPLVSNGCSFFAYSWKLPGYNGAFPLTIVFGSFLLTAGAFLLTAAAFLLTVGNCF